MFDPSAAPLPRPTGSQALEDRISDAQWVTEWHAAGCSPAEMARRMNVAVRNVYKRREHLQGKGHDLPSASANPGYVRQRWTQPRQIDLRVDGGTVLVGSDLHAWPGQISPMWTAFAALAHDMRPDVIVLNGDIIDGTRISRHGRLFRQATPTVLEEIEAAHTLLAMLPPARRYATLGNHDTRIGTYLANMAPELSDHLGGITDRFPDWTWAYSLVINDHTEIRHNFRSGIHGAYNNTLHSGVSVVSGHTHQLGCSAFNDRRGRRYGVETGMLADPDAPQFEYSLGMPRRWNMGFALLTFDDDGALLPPELATWVNGRAVFRGAAIGKQRIRIPARSAAA